MGLEKQLYNVASDWLSIVSDPVILIPIVGGLAFGFVVSLSPWVTDMKRNSDRAFVVYVCNAVMSGVLFIATNLDHDIEAVLSMLILVVGAAVTVPWAFFRWWDRS